MSGWGPGARAVRVVLERYRLDQRLGAGGFGVVWRGHDLKLERDVAVKVVPRGGNDAQRSRTEREALAAARLNHPGIVALYEFGYDDDDLYLVSELVEGATLGELSREGAVSDRDAARIGLALCDALSHAHARGVIHRDVKPANVMVVAEPAAGSGFAKLTDLGIAHVASADDLTARRGRGGHPGLHGPRAGRRPARDRRLRRLLAGPDPVRGVDGHEPGACPEPGRDGATRGAGASSSALASPRPAARAGRGDRRRAGPGPGYRPQPAELRAVLAEVEDGLADEGGLVEPETLERFGLTAVRARTRLVTLMHRAAPDASRAGFTTLHRAAPRIAGGGWAPAPRRGAALAARGAAGLGAGPAGPGRLLRAGSRPVVLAGGRRRGRGAGGGCALRASAGWSAATAVCLWLATEGGQPGTAVVLACALAITPLLLPKAGMLWSAPALAPLLGAVGIAPMFVGLAALASDAAAPCRTGCGRLCLAGAVRGAHRP
ncbi:MAG: serine/threonine-protein kinase [Thermoleophilaceae bacterium]